MILIFQLQEHSTEHTIVSKGHLRKDVAKDR